jgi:glucokinase
VIGPGTGLGVGGVLPTSAGWAAIAGEGGHVTLAAADEEEAALLAWVRRSHGHVSAERLLSGMGLPLLHQAVAAVQGRAAAALSAEQIVSGGLSEAADPLCRETLAHFCAMLGGVAGNVVLTLGARGGLYIGGGIVPRLGTSSPARAFASACWPRAALPITWPRCRWRSSPTRWRPWPAGPWRWSSRPGPARPSCPG